MVMFLCLSWWYTSGWKWAWQRMVADRVMHTAEAFSMKDMLRTLFAPYRQTFANGGSGGPGVWFAGLLDNTISRFIGFTVRFAILAAGLVGVLFSLLTGLLVIAVWGFVPVSPLIGMLFLLIGFSG